METVNDDYPIKSKKQKQLSDLELKAIAIAKHESNETETTEKSKFPTEIIQQINHISVKEQFQINCFNLY